MINKNIQERNWLSSIIKFIIENRKVVFGIAIILALITPISLTKMNDITTLTNRDIEEWDTATNNSYDALKNSSVTLIGNAINRLTSFLQNMADFVFGLITLNFSVISKSGYIFALIYMITPLVALYVIFIIIRKIKDYHFNIEYLKPKYILFTGFILPFSEDNVWIGSILFIFILFYVYFYELRIKLEENKNLSLFENISWKQTIFILAIIILLSINTMYYYLKESFSIQKFINLTSQDLILLLVILCVLLFVSWIISISKISNKPISETLKNKIIDFQDKKQLFYFFVFIIIGISLLNYVINLQNMTDLIIIGINLPWIIFLIIFDPNEWFLIFVQTMKSCFDYIVNASRIIFNTIIAPKPSDLSFFGIFQPTLWITLFLILAVMILLDIFNIYYDNVEFNKSFAFKNYARSFSMSLMVFLLFLFSYVFNAKNFQNIFGDNYQIQTVGMQNLVIPFVFSIIVILVLFILFWSYFQLKKGRNWKLLTKTIFINSLAIFVSLIMITPFIWMLKNSFQTNDQNIEDFLQQGLLPNPFTTRNYAQLFGIYHQTYETIDYRIVTWLFNSLVAAVLVTFFLVIFAAMAGYVIAKREFVGRKTIFTLIIAILMVPPYVQVIPLYLELNRLGFVGTLLGVIFPFLIQPLSIFLATEFMRSIPDDYLDAARVDGYSEFQIFRKIVLPLSTPVISVLIIINLIANWNSFLWPLLLLEQSNYAIQIRTLPLGVYQVNQQLQEQIGVILALSTLVVIPMFIILFLAQDYIKKGVTVEGLKG